MNRSSHWEQVYGTRDSSELSWFEPDPTLSLRLAEAAGLSGTT